MSHCFGVVKVSGLVCSWYYEPIMKQYFKGKKVLLVGLGQLGGGIRTAQFLAEQGAKLTITDMKPAIDLKKTINQLKDYDISFVLGEHREEDFLNNEVIVFNQAVPFASKWVQFAQKHHKQVESDLTLFLELLEQSPSRDYIGVTGTRGKTTVTTWIHHLLRPAVVGGNMPTAGLLKIIKQILAKKKAAPVALELSSFQLEYMRKGLRPAHVAVVTNLYNDHLNRYKTLDVYADMKVNLIRYQTKDDFLILNFDDPHKAIFLKEKPKAKILYVSLQALPLDVDGIFFKNDTIIYQSDSERHVVATVAGMIAHQQYNLLAALLASYLAGKDWVSLEKRIVTLPAIPFRQETVFVNKRITAINDSAATSPEGTVAAIERFKKDINATVFICGGTDKVLDFKGLAKVIKKTLPEKNLYLLNGSATQKLVADLSKLTYFKGRVRLFESLDDIVRAVAERKNIKTIVLSPGAASFEKFKNEFDRGRKFNTLVKEAFK
ncbi:MAG: UDP-N-acetylmuramoylalanine-D-glutamate ligase [Candidatus Wolfebacteria bacterium GW2011_GWC2_39_22]|uniref:UDP-N-acetylmuramoylalanine-D-glutamate ligase n=1 Tax=Candidatus Wolfebacteria bacterium GW2011_GWC2_39_22 TaxID=1619013 RepID=A0A0G0NIJ9_9BACT|nr:MAG: UDP-N-acetylmuramoylalanine-D-glutamate ligase [Candidatus Wolfebacteria bacterium GW2011_GWC2_39_22]HBI26099.1 UDP-N-acetylmuramoyl-L-alanine--D-glutamate ligase [Candidatus Wolfebacteria bacterium]